MSRPAKDVKAVSQAQLRRAYALQQQIARLNTELDALRAEIFDQIEAGAPIEPGTHAARIECEIVGGTSRERLKID